MESYLSDNEEFLKLRDFVQEYYTTNVGHKIEIDIPKDKQPERSGG